MTTVGMPLRWVRAAVLAAVAGFVGLSGHVYAGGLLPDAWVLALVYLAGVVVCAGLLGRPASAVKVLLLTVGGQFGAHIALSLTGGHLGQPAVEMSELGFGTIALEFQGLLVDALGEHGLMTFVHLLASILVGLWLAVGEQTLWGLLSLCRDSFCAVLNWRWCGPLHLPWARLRATDDVGPAICQQRFDGSISRRGPPTYILAA